MRQQSQVSFSFLALEGAAALVDTSKPYMLPLAAVSHRANMDAGLDRVAGFQQWLQGSMLSFCRMSSLHYGGQQQSCTFMFCSPRQPAGTTTWTPVSGPAHRTLRLSMQRPPAIQYSSAGCRHCQQQQQLALVSNSSSKQCTTTQRDKSRAPAQHDSNELCCGT